MKILRFNENFESDIKSGDVIEVMTIFGRGKDELKDVEKKYIGKLYVVEEIQDEDALEVLGGGTWMIDDVRKISDLEKEERKSEIDSIYSEHESRKFKQVEMNKEYLINHINSFRNYLNGKEFDSDNTYDLSNNEYDIKLVIKKK